VNKFSKDVLQYSLAALIVAGEFFVLFWPGIDKSLVMAYHSAFMIVVGYFFGSSKGSADKNEFINKPPQG
jgi:hypothetical protein